MEVRPWVHLRQYFKHTDSLHDIIEESGELNQDINKMFSFNLKVL